MARESGSERRSAAAIRRDQRVHFSHGVSLTALLIGICIPLLGCSSSGGEKPLTTGSVLGVGGGGEPVANAGISDRDPGDPASRAKQVAFTSAGAAKCGFLFDGGKLRAAFLANEASKGSTPDQMKVIAGLYDKLVLNGAAALASDDSYCAPSTVKTIRADLNRHLAGDFALSSKKATQQASSGSFWDIFDQGQKAQIQPLDREAVLFPSGRAH